jgi:hypothetical protein
MATNSIIDNLNPYARRVATHLFRHFPDWATLATTDPNPNADFGALLLEIPANLSGSEIVLHIWSDGDELTVGLHTHHCHFSDYDQRETDEHIEDGVEYIKNLIQENFVIYSWYCNGQFCCSVTGTPGKVEDPAKFISNVDRVTCRSWAGTYDSDDVKVTG